MGTIMSWRPIVERVAARLAGARRLLFVTGAGMSADSGLPTYRGVGGLYDGIETQDGIPIEEALSGGAMRRDPALTWKYIMQIEQACRGAQPNPGHRAIAALEQRFAEVWVLTQNVDGLHREAGSQRIIDIHGDVRKLACTACAWRVEVSDYAGLSSPPRCPDCNAILRPEVVLFGEMLPLDKVAVLQRELERGFDAVFSIGTSSVFPYIAEPVIAARMTGALTVEINPGLSEVSDIVEERLAVGASDALSALAEVLGLTGKT
jgi:NAD-dependent deacetylase